jgi:hypothetical protein
MHQAPFIGIVRSGRYTGMEPPVKPHRTTMRLYYPVHTPDAAQACVSKKERAFAQKEICSVEACQATARVCSCHIRRRSRDGDCRHGQQPVQSFGL